MLIIGDAEVVAITSGAATLAAAGVLAGVAAWTTDKRHKQQLVADRESQERELVAEAARQAAALAHDRELADLTDLRVLLDEAALAIDSGRQTRIEIGVRIAGITVPVGNQQVLVSEAEAELDTMRAKLQPLLARLQVRLGSEDVITKSFTRVDTALLRLAVKATLLSSAEQKGAEELLNDFDQVMKVLESSGREFLKAAVERAGTVSLRSPEVTSTTARS